MIKKLENQSLWQRLNFFVLRHNTYIHLHTYKGKSKYNDHPYICDYKGIPLKILVFTHILPQYIVILLPGGGAGLHEKAHDGIPLIFYPSIFEDF